MKSTVKSTTVDDNEILSDDQTRVLRFTGYQSPFVHDILSCLSSPIGFESAYLKKNPYLRWYGSPPPSSEPNVSFEAKNIPTVETTPTLFFPDLSCLPHHTPTSEPARPLRVRVAPRLDNLFKNNDTPTNLGGGGSRANDCGLAPSAGHGHAFWTPGFSPQANHLAPPRFRCHLRLHQSAYLPGQTVLIRGLWMEASACGPLPAPLSAICPALVATLSLADPTTASRANANAEGISPRPAPPLPLVCALVRVPASIPGGGSDGGMAGKVYANAGGSFLGLALQLPAAAPAGLYTLRIDFLPQTGPSPHSLLPFAEPPLLLPAQCPLRISSPGPPPRFALRLQLDRELADYRLGDPVHVSVLVAPAGDTTATPAQRADPLSLTAAPALPTARSAGGGKPTAMRTKHEKALAFEGDVTLSVTLDDGSLLFKARSQLSGTKALAPGKANASISGRGASALDTPKVSPQACAFAFQLPSRLPPRSRGVVTLHALARAAAADPEADPAVDSVSAAAGDIIDGEGLAGANRAANANLNAPAATSVAIALVHAKAPALSCRVVPEGGSLVRGLSSAFYVAFADQALAPVDVACRVVPLARSAPTPHAAALAVGANAQSMSTPDNKSYDRNLGV